MALTIYVVGHLDSAVAVLNAVAMVFGTGLFASSTGLGFGSVLYLALMVGFMVMLYNIMTNPSTFGGKNGPVQFIGTMLILWVVAGPTTTVQVESLSGGNSAASTGQIANTNIKIDRPQGGGLIATVANVPMGIALPAAMISAFSKEIGTRMETAFSTVSGQVETGMFKSTTTGEPQGFIDPLRILGNFPAAMLSVDPYWNKTFLTAFRDCMTWVGNKEAMLKSPDVLKWLVDNAPGGITTYYEPPAYAANDTQKTNNLKDPNGTPMTCKGAFAKLKIDLDLSVEKTTGSSGGGQYENTNFSKALSMYHSANAQNIQNAMKFLPFHEDKGAVHTYLSSPMVNVATKCANQMASLHTYQDCAQLMLNDARRVYQAHAAGESTLFQQMLLPAMGMLQLIFFALAPMVIIVSAFAPSQMVTLLSKYVFFGLWTQSWLPVAAIINYLVQIDIIREIQAIYATYGNVSVETAGPMMHAVGRKIIVASNLMSSVPLITMAVFTGSYFALAGMAQRFMGSTAGSELNSGLVARQTASVGAAVGIGPDVQHSAGGGTRMTDSPTPMSVNLGSAISSSAGMRIGQTQTHLAQLASTAGTQYAAMATKATTNTDSTQIAHMSATEKGGAIQTIRDTIRGTAQSHGHQMSDAELAKVTYAVAGAIGAMGKLGAGGGKGSPLNAALNAAVSGSFTDTSDASRTETITNALTNTLSNQWGTKEAFTNGWKESDTKTIANVRATAQSNGWSQNDNVALQQTESEAKQASRTLEQATTDQRSYGGTSAADVGNLGIRYTMATGRTGHDLRNQVAASGDENWKKSFDTAYQSLKLGLLNDEHAMAAAAIQSATMNAGRSDAAYQFLTDVARNTMGADLPDARSPDTAVANAVNDANHRLGTGINTHGIDLKAGQQRAADAMSQAQGTPSIASAPSTPGVTSGGQSGSPSQSPVSGTRPNSTPSPANRGTASRNTSVPQGPSVTGRPGGRQGEHLPSEATKMTNPNSMPTTGTKPGQGNRDRNGRLEVREDLKNTVTPAPIKIANDAREAAIRGRLRIRIAKYVKPVAEAVAA